MEYCEGRSLRHIIDNGILLENRESLWTLFHEILEGMSYIHSKGIIHRDLKPGNIFLDSHGHAKIGDFGLATVVNLQQMPGDLKTSFHGSLSSLDAEAGTALYMAPEVHSCVKNLPLTQKIDMYSLGIILFEMLNPFNTGMERIKVLTQIRNPDFNFTDQNFPSLEVNLLNHLLCHNPLKRPSAAEILSWNVLPAAKHEEIDEILKHALKDKKSAQFRKVLQTLLSLENTKAISATYDSEFFKSCPHPLSAAIQENVKNYFIQLFLDHGAVPAHVPLLMPKSPRISKETEIQNLQLMTSAGCIVVLPHSLRVSFARYVAQNGIRDLKAYQIGPVFRECSAEMHPRVLLECAFDIVFTSDSLLPELELFSLIQDIYEKYPVLKEKDSVLNISHTSLLPAILSSCGVSSEQSDRIMTFLAEYQLKDEECDARKVFLSALDISEEHASKLSSLLSKEGPLDAMIPHFRFLCKQKFDPTNTLKFAVEELTAISVALKEMDFPIKVHLSPCLTHKENHFSGIMFQLSRHKFGKKPIFEVLARGGRYDKQIEMFNLEVCKKYDNVHAVGISFAIERITSIIEAEIKQNETYAFPFCDTILYAVSEKPLSDSVAVLCKELWRRHLPVTVIYKNYANKLIDDMLSSMPWRHLVSVKDDSINEPEIKLRTTKGERIFEKNLTINNVVEYISCHKIVVNSENDSMQSPFLIKSLSSQIDNHSLSQINVINLAGERQCNFKKKLEIKMRFRLANLQQLFNPKVTFNVIAVECTVDMLHEMRREINLDSSMEVFISSWHAFARKNVKCARALTGLYGIFLRLRYTENEHVFVLYSVEDDAYTILLSS